MKLHLASALSRIFSHILLLRYALFSGKVLSVRAICTRDGKDVYLVRHSYTPGWHLPGGGIDNGMSSEEALLAELREEGHLVPLDRPVLRQIYLKSDRLSREHVVFYTVSVAQETDFTGTLEIVESRFFGLDSLPADLDPAAHRRITEWATGAFSARDW